MSAVTALPMLFGAGLLAGVVGTAGGITSLISYPALLWAGLPALSAAMANNIALVACWPGSAIASRPELSGRGPWLRRWGLAAAAGGAAGAILLLSTPAGTFGRIVPFLVALGSVALLLQPRLRSLAGSAGGRRVLLGGVVALSVYNTYFGAGSGVLPLALMLLAADPHLARANALKNMLLGPSSITSAVLFVILSPVDWAAVGPLAAGLFAGATIGPRVARRMPATVLRWLVASVGLALAAWLWAGQGR